MQITNTSQIKYTHSNPFKKKTYTTVTCEYNAQLSVCLIAKDELNRVQSCCPYSGQLFLFAAFKDLNSEVTGSNDALFEIYQRCGPYLLITNDFVISLMSFPAA